MDRAYRKYFKMESIPAVFIDSSEDNPGVCLQEKVKQVPELVNAKKGEITKYIEKNIQLMKNRNSDDDAPKTNGTNEDSNTTEMNGNDAEHLNSTDDLLMCSANRNTCQVHSEKRKCNKWRLISQPESLNELISSLNKRGIREVELSQALQFDKTQLLDCVTNTPLYLLGQESADNPQPKSESFDTDIVKFVFSSEAKLPPKA